MDSKTYYRKYRPHNFAELDLPEIGRDLAKIFSADHFPQTFLFAGPKGTGKTSAARLVAKAANCQHLKHGEPCNQCGSCLAIDQGNDLDLWEIDAASNRGIDDIRELKDKIKLSPLKNQYKVYIIDEVHMLTREAFNALLKTLEEPPAHALFVLCTTELQKLPETIVSRCLLFNFRRAKTSELLQALKRAVVGEKLIVEDAVLASLAEQADGSFRDAHKLLEHFFFTGSSLISAQVEPEKFLTLVRHHQQAAALQELARLNDLGVDFAEYLLRILKVLRLDIPTNLELIKLFLPLAAQIKTTPIASLPLEIAVVEYCQNSEPVSVSLEVEKETTSDLPALVAQWDELLRLVRPQNHSVEGLLRSARPLKVEGDVFTLEVFYRFHKEQLETAKCRSIVETAAQHLLHNPNLRLKCVLGEKSSPKRSEADIIDVAKEIFK